MSLFNEYYIAYEGKDLQASAMAVDFTGNLVLLAGRRCIAIKNLEDDNELQMVQKYPRQSKYDVNCAEWNSTKFNKHLCAISSNQKLEINTLSNDNLTQMHVIKAHTRVITSLSWHFFDPNLLASCSVDAFIHLWDIRECKRPSLSLSAIAEASQVKFNRLSPHILATAHDGDIKIWDQRKGTSPVQYISAHVGKIHSIEWSPFCDSQIASCSQDNTVKFFDTTVNPRRAEFVLTTNSPVWRARYTPFGNGLVTVVVPQLRRGENNLLLWNTVNASAPMHTFVGHRDVILEFHWRNLPANERDFQLVTWSKDQSLLVWRIEPFLQRLCGYDPDDLPKESQTKEEEEKVLPKMKTQPLQQEFSLLNVHIPNLEVKSMDVASRTCSVKVTINNYKVFLEVTFPNAYPHGVPPVFQVTSQSNINDNVTGQLLQTLNHLAQQRVSKNRTCLEPCLRQMVTSLEQFSNNSENNSENFDTTTYMESPNIFGSYNDAYIPFPRTSGAKFCSVSTLVCFGQQLPVFKIKNDITTTPRALSALENLLGKKLSDHMTVSAYYFQKQQQSRAKLLSNKGSNTKASVNIYDAQGLFFVSKQLAQEYILDGDVSTICRHNALAAKNAGRWDLFQAWTLAELVASPQQADEEMSWSRHPFGNQLMPSLITHYALQSDIQMAAMLSCIFGKEQDHLGSGRKGSLKALLPSGGHFIQGKRRFKTGGSPYHTIPPADVINEVWPLNNIKSTRSTSLDNIQLDQSLQVICPQKPSTTISLYEYYKLAYAETLHRWGLLYKRTEIVKYMGNPAEVHRGVEFLTDCKHCVKPAKYSSCTLCKRLVLNCIICHVSVKGAANCCVLCGHGGHLQHLRSWFKERKLCPTGCGCHCIIESKGVFIS